MLTYFLGFNGYKIKDFIIKANNGYWANLIMYNLGKFWISAKHVEYAYLFHVRLNPLFSVGYHKKN